MSHTALAVKMILDRWNGSVANFSKHLDAISDEQLQKEIVPGKNRGIYLLGHLVAVHDDMLLLLGLGDKLFPELYEPFLKEADKVAQEIPGAAVLRDNWKKQCEILKEKFSNLQPGQWFEKHTRISEEDFVKEPQRNKLNIIITRTSHLEYHLGQLILLK